MLALSPHTDDVELSAGGTVQRLIEAGAHVRYVALSPCDESTPAGFEVGVLLEECKASTEVLGIEDVEFGSFPVRHFPQHRQAILEYLYALNQDYRPDLVLCPSSADRHQDHGVVYDEACRIFKDTTLWGYFCPWNAYNDPCSLYIGLEERHLCAKRRALACYRSQQGRPYMDNLFVRSWARYAARKGMEFAEAFEVIRMVL